MHAGWSKLLGIHLKQSIPLTITKQVSLEQKHIWMVALAQPISRLIVKL